MAYYCGFTCDSGNLNITYTELNEVNHSYFVISRAEYCGKPLLFIKENASSFSAEKVTLYKVHHEFSMCCVPAIYSAPV